MLNGEVLAEIKVTNGSQFCVLQNKNFSYDLGANSRSLLIQS